MSVGVRLGSAVSTYLIGFFLTNIGVGGFTLAIGLTLYKETGTVLTFGVLVAVEYALGFVGQLVGGSVLDRLSVLRVALASNTLRGVAVLCGGALFLVTGVQLPLIGAFLISAFIRPLYRSASFVLVRQICTAGELPRINALRFGLLQAAQLGGLGIVAGLFVVSSPGLVICVVALFMLAGTATLAVLRRLAVVTDSREADNAARPRTFAQNWRELGQAFSTVPGLWVHLAIGGMPAVIASLATVLVAPVNQAVSGGSFGIAVLDGGASVGALVTILGVRRLDPSRPMLVGIASGLATTALCLLSIGDSLPVAGVAFLLLGVAAALGATTLDTLLQRRAAPAILGRLSISQECAVSLSAIVLIPLSGPMTSHWGLHGTAFVYAGVAAVYLLLYLVGFAVLRDRLFNQRVDFAPEDRARRRSDANVLDTEKA